MTRLQFERLRRRWSQTELAARAGKLAPSDISRYERGYARPYPPQAARLAAALGVTPDELLDNVEGLRGDAA